MKLFELFEPIRKTIDTRKKNTSLNQAASHDTKHEPKNLLGSGAFSHVTSSKDEHMVNKTSRGKPTLRGLKDAFWDYADTLIHQGIWKENPYFPRFYSIKEYKTQDGTRYKGTMEKLVPLDKVSPDAALGWLHKTFDIECLKSRVYYSNVLSDNASINDDEEKNFYMGKIIVEIFTDLDSFKQCIIDEKLTEAIAWLEKQAWAMGMDFDFHSGNVMFRTGPYGGQLVFSDPFVYSG